MTKLDPFVIQWPAEWTNDPEIGPVVYYLNRFLHDLFVLLDGGRAIEEDLNSSTSAKIAGLLRLIDEINIKPDLRSELAVLSKRVGDLELQQ